MPGVSLARGDGGEGKQITVRGLDAGFTRVRINGIEGVTATGASDINGSTNRGRGFDFSVFASELFNSLEVRKTSEAAVEEGSLGATVDLRTARPFDFKGRTASFGGQELLQHAVAKDPAARDGPVFGPLGHRLSARSARSSRRPIPSARATEEGYEAVETAQRQQRRRLLLAGRRAPQNPANNAGQGHHRRQLRLRRAAHLDPAAYNSVIVAARTITAARWPTRPPARAPSRPRIPRYRRSQTEYERTGITSALQWRPTASTELNLDLHGRQVRQRALRQLHPAPFPSAAAWPRPTASRRPRSSMPTSTATAAGTTASSTASISAAKACSTSTPPCSASTCCRASHDLTDRLNSTS